MTTSRLSEPPSGQLWPLGYGGDASATEVETDRAEPPGNLCTKGWWIADLRTIERFGAGSRQENDRPG